MIKLQVTRLHSLTGHRDCVYTLQPSINPSIIFSGAGDGMIAKWDLEKPESGELIAKLPNSVYALHSMPGHDILIVGHNYDGIHLLDWKNNKEVASLKLTAAPIFDIQSYHDLIFVATGDGALMKVSAKQLTKLGEVKASDKSARTIAVNPRTGEVAVGYSDYYIRVFDIDSLKLKHQWQAHTNSVFTLRYSPAYQYLLSGGRDARLKVWEARAGYVQAAEIVAHLYAINHIEFSPDGKHFVTCSMDKSIKVWDTEELKLLKVIDKARHAGHGTSVNKLLWTSHHHQLVSASDDRTISVWNINFEYQAL